MTMFDTIWQNWKLQASLKGTGACRYVAKKSSNIFCRLSSSSKLLAIIIISTCALALLIPRPFDASRHDKAHLSRNSKTVFSKLSSVNLHKTLYNIYNYVCTTCSRCSKTEMRKWFFNIS